MPDGRVSRYDDNRGSGFIETKSGSYTVRAEDMAPDARVEGAMVTFDVEHDDPHDRAVDVQLREGTRNAPAQERFGDTG